MLVFALCINKTVFSQNKEVSATIMQKYSELRTWKYAYPNGVSIVVRPDDSAALVHIRAFSPGGALLFPAADYATALHAGEIVGAGISAKLAGTHISFVPKIGPQFSNLKISCRQNELETALKLIAACFTGLEKDVKAGQDAIVLLKKQAKLSGNEPKAVLAAAWNSVAGYPDGQSAKAISSLDVDKAYEIFKTAFSSAGNFNFVFTGKLKESTAMNTSKLLPLISGYIGALPSKRDITALIKAKPNTDHFLAEGTAVLLQKTPVMPSGKILKTLYAGNGPGALVRMTYHGDYQYTDSTDLQLKVLAGLLEEQLKKDAGLKINDFSIILETGKYPKENYSLTIDYSCLPDAVAGSSDHIQESVAALQKNIDPEAIKRFVTAQKLLLKQQYFDNDFWTDYFKQELMKKEDPYDIAHYPFYFRKATPATLKKAASKLLDGKNYIRLVVLPAKMKHK